MLKYIYPCLFTTNAATYVDTYRFCAVLSKLANAVHGTVYITINDVSPKTRFFGLHFWHRQYRCIFNHFDV